MAQRVKTDWTLFGVTVGMVCLGLVMVYSTSSVMAELRYRSGPSIFLRQLGWAVASVGAMMWLRKRSYRVLDSPAWAFTTLGLVLVALIAVYFLDARTHRWFRLGPASLQPAEFAKPALIVFLAWFVSARSRNIESRHTWLPASMALAVLAATVIAPDFGTAVVLVAIAAAVFYVAGFPRIYFAVALAAALLLGSAAVIWKPYRLGRVIAFVDPEHAILNRIDPNQHIVNYVKSGSSQRDPGYQARQSKIAVGTGGVFGLGLMQGVMKLLYLPEAHNDFIYAVVGEELGLLGTTAILAGFIIILWRGLRLFWMVPDDFGRYLALGVTVSVVVQAFINMSVVLDLGPTKGIPLPMISAGGSSLLSTLMSLGILLNVSDHCG
jgi:cell division protein FtsW